MKISLNTSTIKPQPLMEKIRLTAKAGYDGVELWINDIYEYIGQGGEVSDVEKELDATGLTVPCVIAMRQWAEAEGFEYRIQLDEAKRRMELAARLKSPWIVATPSFLPCDIGQTTRRYRDLLEIGRAAGVKPTFEYISFFKSVFRLKQAWQVVQDANDPDATVILDAFHNWNSATTLDDIKAIPVDRISHYHINDAGKGRPQMQLIDADRVMVGDGQIDLKAELQVLKDKGYDKWLSLELFNAELWAKDPLDVLKLGLERIQSVL